MMATHGVAGLRMFKRLTRAFRPDPPAPGREAAPPARHKEPVSEWAASRGLTVWGDPEHTVSLYGTLNDYPWRMEVGNPSRDYIHGRELRARAELGLVGDVGAMIVHQPLKQALQRRAQDAASGGNGTPGDAPLPEEVHWLRSFQEVAWSRVPDAFRARYAVLAQQPEDGPAWVGDRLVRVLLEWPAPGLAPEVPFMLVLRRGRCYLRMQYEPADTIVLEHATKAFHAACRSALAAFGD